MESHAGDVGRVSIEGEDCIGVGRLDVVELDGVVASSGEVALVGGYAETIYLRVWVRDCAGADAAEGFPEALVCVLVEAKALRDGQGAYRIVWSYPAVLVSCLHLPSVGSRRSAPVHRMTDIA